MRIFLFLLIGLCLNSFSLMAKEPIFVEYGVKDGLPSSFIYDIIQDDEGIIWVATDKGISKFDGKEFTNYTVKDGLPNNDVFGFEKDSDGRVWLNTLDHCAFVEEGKIYTVNHPENIGVHSHFFDKNERHIVRGGDLSLNFVLDDSLQMVPLGFPDHFVVNYTSPQDYSIVRAKDSKAFIISKFENSETIQDFDLKFPFDKKFDRAWIQDRHFWSGKEGIQYLEGRDLKFIDHKKMGFKSPLTRVDILHSGFLVQSKFKTAIVGFDFITTREFDFINQLDFNNVYEDVEGNFWFATKDGLLFVTRGATNSQSFYFGRQKKASNETAIKIIKDSAGNILVATVEGSIYRYENEELKLLFKTGLKGLRDLAQDGYGKLWLATEEFGCFRLNNLDKLQNKSYQYSLTEKNTFRTKDNNAVFRATVKALKMGPDNRLYVASSKGVSRIEFKEDYYEVTKLDSSRSYSVAQDLFGFIWIGRTSGISRFKDGKLVNLGSNHPISDLSVTDIDVDKENGLWIGSDGFGLFHDRGTALCQIEQLDGFIIKSVYIDEYDQIWAATNRGVVKINKKKDGDDSCEYDINYFSLAHGLASEEVNDILVSGNKLFAATKDGVSIIPIPTSTDKSTVMSPLVVKSIKINGIGKAVDSIYTLEYNENDLKIEFASLSYQNLGKILYEYKMEGIDSTWQTTVDRFREYQTLNPGKYIFHLRAKDIGGNLISAPLALQFKIKRAWWNRWWFRLLYLTLAFLLFSFYSQYRIRQTKLKADRENEVNKKFAELEMQAIRSQMNPHFLFNALHSIQDYIFKNDSREANKYISSFAKLMRKILDASKKKYIYLYEELEMIRLYIDLEKLRFQNKFDYQIDIEGSIDQMATEIPTMIIQPFVENAINHGLLHRKEAGRLELNIYIEGSKIIVLITDNGIGIKKSQELKSKSGLKHKSQGTQMINTRMELMNEMYNTEIDYEMTDLDPLNKEYPGTKVKIRILKID